MTNASFNDDARILGDTDETLIGNVGDRLKVTNQGESPGIHVSSQKLRVIFEMNDTTVPTAYTTMYSYSGSGLFYAMYLDFNHHSVETKLTIDGTEVILEIVLEDLEKIFGASIEDSCGIGITNGDRLKFCPPAPIPYESQVLIESRRTTSPDRNLNRLLVTLTKET